MLRPWVYIHIWENMTLKSCNIILTLIEHCLLLDNGMSLCENAKWHLWVAMTAAWHAGEIWLTLVYEWKLTYYE